MIHLLTLYDVKEMLETDHVSYECKYYEYGFSVKYVNKEGISIIYYFNQEGKYIYPMEDNLNTLGKQI